MPAWASQEFSLEAGKRGYTRAAGTPLYHQHKDKLRTSCKGNTHKHRQVPVQPESVKSPLLVGQAAEPVPQYPEAHVTTQLAAVSEVPMHPVVMYPVVVAGRVQVLAVGCVEKETYHQTD